MARDGHHRMVMLTLLSANELDLYYRIVSRAVEVRNHYDVLSWLQGDMQRYLPHDIMVAAWGDFGNGRVQHDIITALPNVRSRSSDPVTLTPLFQVLFDRWNEFGRMPLSMKVSDGGFFSVSNELDNALGGALQKMRTAVVHGIIDERGSHDCLYVAFSALDVSSVEHHKALSMLMPYIDVALRQIQHLPHQAHAHSDEASSPDLALCPEHSLTEREMEIMHWTELGKTNSEIGAILEISAFTVKNHLQHIFKKLNVSNRAQAVSEFLRNFSHAHI